jgi:microcystin-dependent protein
LLCFGQAISRTVYSTLFTAIGTTYGVGDGSTTFLLPDMRGRVVAGQDDMGGTSANRIDNAVNGDTLGAAGGSQIASIVVNTTDPLPANAAAPFQGGGTGWNMASHQNIQPTIILNYIIKT